MLATVDDALAFLRRLGASETLVLHHEMVAQVAQDIASAVRLELGCPFDRDQMLIAAALHDCGKIQFPEELGAPGERHCAAGELMLLRHGLPETIARVCRTHCEWKQAIALEDLFVALADIVWKGTRDEVLEMRVVDGIAARVDLSAWEVFARLEPVLARIADGGVARLSRCQTLIPARP